MCIMVWWYIVVVCFFGVQDEDILTELVLVFHMIWTVSAMRSISNGVALKAEPSVY